MCVFKMMFLQPYRYSKCGSCAGIYNPVSFHFFTDELDAGRFEPDVLLSLEHCNDDDDSVICVVVDNCD